MGVKAMKIYSQKDDESHWSFWCGNIKNNTYKEATVTAITSYYMGDRKPDGYRIDDANTGKTIGLRDHFQSAKSVAMRHLRGEVNIRHC